MHSHVLLGELEVIALTLQGFYKPNVARVASAEAGVSLRAQAVAVERLSDAWINLSREEWQHRSACRPFADVTMSVLGVDMIVMTCRVMAQHAGGACWEADAR